MQEQSQSQMQSQASSQALVLSSKFWWQLLASLIIGLLLCYLAFRNENFDLQKLKSISFSGFIAYWFVFAFAHWIRIARWGLFIKALTSNVSWWDLLKIGGIGYLCISILPFRIGEAIRPYMLQRQGILSASASTATVVVERVIDGLLFVCLFFIFLSILPPTQHTAVALVKMSALMAGIFFAVVLILLVFAYFKRAQTIAFIKSISDRISTKLTEKGLGILEAFLDGLAILPKKNVLLGFLFLTLIYWVLQGISMVWLAQAVGMYGLDWIESFALLAILVVGIMLPAGPGYTGSFELALKGGFALVTIDNIEQIPIFIIVLHFAQLSVQILFGVLAFLIPSQNHHQSLKP